MAADGSIRRPPLAYADHEPPPPRRPTRRIDPPLDGHGLHSLLLFAVLAFAGALWALTLGIPEDGNLWYFTYLLLVACGFFSGFWMKGGQTLGMKTWRLRVETDQGQTLGLKQALLRFFAAILAWLPAGLGFLWMLVDPKRKALHDHISGTRIVTLPKPQK